MIEIKIKEILKVTHGRLINGDAEVLCEKIEIDSREVDSETIFMPILGETQDGHIYLLKAFENGALYSFCEEIYFENNKKELLDKNLIVVENTTKALHLIATYILDKCKVKKVGITGSLGKTSTKEMIYHVLNEKFNVHRNRGNFNNHIGLPLTVFELSEEHDVAVLEMGMNHFKEIETLADIVKPDIGVITNVGTSHIGNLKSQDNIFKAKMEIVTYFSEKNTLIINANDEYLANIKSDTYKIIKTGIDGDFTLNGYDLARQSNGCYSYKLDYLNDTYEVRLNVLGKHNVNNSLLALAVGLELLMPINDCIKGLSKFAENEKRLELINIYNENIIINDCYNASSESMISAIDVLIETPGNKKIAVLGDVLELGDFSRESHEKVGSYLASSDVDYIFTYGEASEYIRSKAVADGFNEKNIFSFSDQKELIESLISIIEYQDIILVKGSFGMNMINIVDALRVFKK